jgi:hypothetical protein
MTVNAANTAAGDMEMPKQIERKPTARGRIGVSKTHFEDNFILHDESDPFVPNTDDSVPRLRKVPLGGRAVGFFSDEVDKVIDALRRWRDHQAASPRIRSARR